MSAADRGWGTGWPGCQSDKIRTLVRSDGLRLPVRVEILGMVRLLMDRTEALGYDVRPGETWGFACRPIRGTSVPSNHSWGLAVDINAPANPMASADWHRRNARQGNSTFPFGLRIVTDMPEIMVALWEDNGWKWGGRYTNRPDPMHFEYAGTPTDAGRTIYNLEPGGSMASQLDRIEAQLTGKTEKSLRHFIQDQDRRTREIVLEDGKKTRAEVLKQAENTRTAISWQLAAQMERIEELANRET